MKKKGTKIISYFLLLNFLAMSFPVYELFHNHKSTIIECFSTSDNHGHDHDHQDHFSDSELKEKCLHKAHFSEKQEEHICFYTYFDSSFLITDINIVTFRGVYFGDFILKNIRKHYLKSFQSYLLRGPPTIYLLA